MLWRLLGLAPAPVPFTGASPELAGAYTSLSGGNHRRIGFLLLVTDEVEESWTGWSSLFAADVAHLASQHDNNYGILRFYCFLLKLLSFVSISVSLNKEIHLVWILSFRMQNNTLHLISCVCTSPSTSVRLLILMLFIF